MTNDRRLSRTNGVRNLARLRSATRHAALDADTKSQIAVAAKAAAPAWTLRLRQGVSADFAFETLVGA